MVTSITALSVNPSLFACSMNPVAFLARMGGKNNCSFWLLLFLVIRHNGEHYNISRSFTGRQFQEHDGLPLDRLTNIVLLWSVMWISLSSLHLESS